MVSTPNVRQMLLDMDELFNMYLDLPGAVGGASTSAPVAAGTGAGNPPRDMAE
ncbi:MAG: hypothetical protein M9953_12475 [Thermomicrobiales bacterium]|nr:hypothetical protein [Thermomicrobiales bacterium]